MRHGTQRAGPLLANTSGVPCANVINVEIPQSPAGRPRRVRYCAWCGRRVPESGSKGRPRLYCAQSCRQRAYERRTSVHRSGLPEDAVVLSATELADLQDRLFQLRCAAEDVTTAVDDAAEPGEVRKLANQVVRVAAELERLR